MLQFNKSETTNTNAVWIDVPSTASGYYNSLIVAYSQSYDNSNGTFPLTTVSAPNQYRNWLVISNSGSLAPTPSGQYNVAVYTYTFADAKWNAVATAWDSFNEIWATAGQEGLVDLIYSDRAYVSGSNEQDITQYVSSNENGTYITYNG
jgi:hypothetical protein